jgi:hypothetical protein
VSQSNRRYYNKPIVHHYGKSIVVQKDKIARSCPALHTLSVTIVTSAVTTLPIFQHNIQLGLLLYMEGTKSKQSILHINVRENRKCNQIWKIQRNWQHWVLKTQDEDKQKQKTQHRKLKRWATRTPLKAGGEYRRPKGASSSYLPQDTRHVTHIVNTCWTTLYTRKHK